MLENDILTRAWRRRPAEQPSNVVGVIKYERKTYSLGLTL